MECQGVHSCNLSRGNAENWYAHTSDGYARGSTPKLGAVICWHSTRSGGHVAIVEKIYANGKILTSNSAFSGSRFYTQKLTPPNYRIGSAYTFQGFIYNPTEFTDDPTPDPPSPSSTSKNKFKWVLYSRKLRNKRQY